MKNGNQNLNQEKLQPSYYAILPAGIRYDKNLNSTEKLLYAEITALCDREGYCWASNSYFAELLDKRNDYISKVITKLDDKEYIRVEVTKNQSGTFRKIYAGIYTRTQTNGIIINHKRASEITPSGIVKKDEGGSDLVLTGSCFSAIQKNNINNTIKNNINNTIKNNINNTIKNNIKEHREDEEIKNQKPVLKSKIDLFQSDPLFSQFLEIANRIKKLIETQKRIKITNIQVANWAVEVKKLYKTLELARGSKDAIYGMFLMINTLNADTEYEDKYKPVIESGKSFREKFIKIEDYYKRRQIQHDKQQQEEDIVL